MSTAVRKSAFLLVVLCSSLPLHAESRLIFPRVLFQQGRFAGIAIANPTAATARITLTAYQADGSPFSGSGVTNPVTADIPAGQQYSALAKQIFNPPASVGESATPTRLWMQVTSPTDGLTGFFLDGNDALDFMDGSDLGTAAISLTLPLVENTGSSTTEISLVNPQATPATVEIELFNSAGKEVSSHKATIAARGALQGLLSSLFATSYNEVAGLRVRSDRPVLCFGYILRQGGSSLVTVAAQNSGLAAKTLYFPQLAQGDIWSTSIGVLNLTNTEAAVTITAYRPDGTLFSAPTVRENPVTKNLPGGGVFRAGAKELFGFADSPLQVGWIKAETTRSALYGYVEYGAGKDRALVSAQIEAYDKAIFSHQALAAPFFTGLAVLNTGALATDVEVVSLTKEGKILGKAQRVLKPGQRESLLVEQWIRSAAGTVGGSLIVKSGAPVVATELFGTVRDNSVVVLANVPPQKVTTAFDPGASLPTIKISPAKWVIETGKTKKFDVSGASQITWNVNDAPGGTSAFGTVGPDGTYKAPTIAPQQHSITLGASTPGGEQSGGASITVVQRETLVSGLALVTSVAYFENLQRFFIAEQQTLASAPSSAGDVRAAVGDSTISEYFPDGTRKVFLQIPNDSIGKMLPFQDAKKGNYMLIAGSTSGRIYRVNLANPKELTTVAQGLNKPNSMTLEPKTGDLLVCEEGKVTTVPRNKFDPALAAPGLAAATKFMATTQRSIDVPSPRGIAVDRCSQAVYVTTETGDLLEYQGNRKRTVVTGLTKPNEILPFYIDGIESCEEALVLLICEEDAVALVFPSLDIGFEFVADTGSPRDLEFFPAGSPFIKGGEASIGIAEQNSISEVGFGDIYDEDDPLTNEEWDFAFDKELPYRDPEEDTFESDASYAKNLQVPDIITVDALKFPDSVVLGFEFAETAEEFKAGSARSVGGYIDLDLDQDFLTGIESVIDEYLDFGLTLLGVDAYIDLFKGTFVNVSTRQETPIDLIYVDNALVIVVPKSLADISQAGMAIVVTNIEEPTDIAPDILYLDIELADQALAPGDKPVRVMSAEVKAEKLLRMIPPPHRPRAIKAKRQSAHD